MNRFRDASYRVPIVLALLLAVNAAGFVPANAGIVGTGVLLEQSRREARLAQVEAFLQRDEVRSRLVDLGVDPIEAEQRVQALTDEELTLLAERLDELPAGGVLALIGATFVVLLILELVGVINVFSRL